MRKRSSWITYFSVGERLLWLGSVGGILAAFFLFGGQGVWTVVASLLGVTALIFNAKGNPIGQALMIVFSLFYGWISYTFAYYGEMLTYLGMSMPMAVLALISWLRHPHAGRKSEVQVAHVSRHECGWLWVLTIVITGLFYFLLKALGTANLLPSTVSVTTSFLAVYLTFRRSPYYAVAYAANDVVLMVLWTLATIEQPQYLSVTVCFAAFLVNDIYGFINWRRMGARQAAEAAE